MSKRSLYSWLLIGIATLLCACGGGSSSSSDSTPSYIRLVNATQVNDLQMQLTADDTTTTSATVDTGSAGGYDSFTPDSYAVVVSAADGSLSASSTSSLTLSTDVYYTVVAYARGGQIKLLKLTDSKSTPSTGFASMTVTNVGSDAGAVDIYVVSPGASITSLSPTFSDVTAGASSLTNTINAGTYDIVVTANNKPNDVRLTMSSVTLTSTQIVDLVLTPTTGGTLVDGALVTQKGAVSLQPANKARVRVAAAFPAGVSSNVVVATTVGGSALNSVTAPSIGSYSLVPADATAYTVSVDGVAISNLPTTTFASGGDYTIMVYGASSASPAISVFTDDNQLPTSGAKIRLINGAVANAGLSLSDNYVPLFSEISYGQASEYSGISSGTSLLQLTSPVTTFTSYSTTVSIQSNGVYSLFVLGTTDDAIKVLSRDK